MGFRPLTGILFPNYQNNNRWNATLRFRPLTGILFPNYQNNNRWNATLRFRPLTGILFPNPVLPTPVFMQAAKALCVAKIILPVSLPLFNPKSVKTRKNQGA